MKRTVVRVLAPVAVLGLVAAGCGDDDDSGNDTPTEESARGRLTEVQSTESILDQVRAADVVRCGVRDDLPGFSVADESGEHVGFDADFCRVIAAGVLGDATKVEFVDVATENRFTALAAGEFDVLVRNTTWTASRDGAEGVTFLSPTFYDGQAMMVAADSGYESIDDMDGAVVCVAAGTTHEAGVRTEFAKRGLSVEVQSFPDVDLLQEAFIAGSCDGWTSDNSQLRSLRSNYPDGPDALVIFDDVFTKEPLAPGVVDGDSAWAQAVEWSIFATLQAEEYGITAANAEEMLNGDDAAVVAFLGGPNADGTVADVGLGLDPSFAYDIVSQVGNYGEIYDANLSDLDIPRGLNALWTDGGLQYAPPYR